MGANPHANGGLLLKDLNLPDYREYAVAVPTPGEPSAEATRVMGELLRDVVRLNAAHRNFRVVGPTICTCAATRKRARPRRPLTWRC
jgi:xylulose-5-phosphate/fructose-6-phosphate phosphoketolase